MKSKSNVKLASKNTHLCIDILTSMAFAMSAMYLCMFKLEINIKARYIAAESEFDEVNHKKNILLKAKRKQETEEFR